MNRVRALLRGAILIAGAAGVEFRRAENMGMAVLQVTDLSSKLLVIRVN
jgi:hypothetical protein